MRVQVSRFRASRLVAVAMLCALAACSHAPAVNSDFTAGEAAVNNRDYKSALTDFARAEASGFEDARLPYDAGLAAYQLKRWAQADDEFSKALARVAQHPGEIEAKSVRAAHFFRGVSRSALNRYAGSKSDLLEAVRDYPQSSLAWACLGWDRAGLGDDKGAVVDYDRSLRLNPRDWADRYNRGVSLEKSRQYKRAIADLTAVIRHGTYVGMAAQYRGLAYSARGQNALADKDLSLTLRRTPNAWAWLYRCEVRESLGHARAALSDCNRAIAPYPRWSAAYLDRAWAKATLGSEKGALADVNTAIKYSPRFALAYRYRGWIRARMSQYRGAFMDYARALAIAPGFTDARTARSSLGNWILAAQHAGVTRFGIASLNVAQLENESAPTQSEYQRMTATCGGYFSSGDSYFDDCLQKGVEEAQNDRSADSEAEQQAEADNYEVAQQVQEQINYQQQEAQNEQAAAEEQAGYAENSGNENSGEGTSEEASAPEESAPQEEAPVESAPEAAPESGGE